MYLRSFSTGLVALGVSLAATSVQAQTPPAAGPYYGPSGYGAATPQPYAAPGYTAPSYAVAGSSNSSSRRRDPSEMVALYGTSAAYGVGMGVWVSTEIGTTDPGIFLIAPAVLGIGAPIGVWSLDQPAMHRGTPTAITAGLLLGAGEGVGIASVQMVRTNADNAWGLRGLARATAIGSTAGGILGWATGTFLEPPPTTSVLSMSGAVWGTAIGSMFAYGSTSASSDYAQANDTVAAVGLVGYNVGAIAAAAYGMAAIPSWNQIGWMWGGAGIGAAVSLPVFLFYAGDGGPPARRGFVFMGTATTLGLLAGGVFASGGVTVGQRPGAPRYAADEGRHFARLLGVAPMVTANGLGLSLAGTLE